MLRDVGLEDRKSTRLNSSHVKISYAVFCLKKKTQRGLGQLFLGATDADGAASVVGDRGATYRHRPRQVDRVVRDHGRPRSGDPGARRLEEARESPGADVRRAEDG